MPTKLTPEIISAAILGFEEQKRHIDANIAELRAILSGDSAEAAVKPEPTKHKRRKVSAAGRARIAEAQRKRWAESKAAAQPSTPEVTHKPKRKLSEAGRKAIVAATKKRWALKRAEAAKTQQAAPKKTAVKKVVAKKAVAKKTAKTSTPAAAKTAS
ncbi:MAG TPA: hypothetical protein VNY05_22215 [Candidatus Acidoferrales bacterium]|jgi:hypothetical protein|nr:hypothetical protein [Candidatus Acidoferrales bacterium]